MTSTMCLPKNQWVTYTFVLLLAAVVFFVDWVVLKSVLSGEPEEQKAKQKKTLRFLLATWIVFLVLSAATAGLWWHLSKNKRFDVVLTTPTTTTTTPTTASMSTDGNTTSTVDLSASSVQSNSTSSS